MTQVVTRRLINLGHTVLAAHDGFLGLAQGHITELEWKSVSGWTGRGGCELGTNRVLPDRINGREGIIRIAAVVAALDIHALIVVGGFEAFQGVLTLCQSREESPELKIPMCSVPVTISNNIPGTDVSIGADTALNTIVGSIDRLKLSAASSRAQLFLVEVMGGHCGHLATLGALAGGADSSYTHEDNISLETMQDDVEYLREKFINAKCKHAVVVRNELCSRLYTMSFMQSLFEQEGQRRNQTKFSVRNNVLGHLQQGNSPSPLDRVFAARLGFAAVNFVMSVVSTGSKVDRSSYSVIGVAGNTEISTPVEDLIEKTDFELCRPKYQGFTELKPLVRILEYNNSGKWGDDIEYTPCARIPTSQEVEAGC